MSICTACGAVMHPEDIYTHICDAADLPTKGQQKKPVTTTEAIK